MGKLVLVRHGESLWNKEGRFTGWVDIPLSEKGIKQAVQTGKKLKNIKIDVAFTSKLTRAQESLLRILAQQKCTGVFLHKSRWRKTWSMHMGKEFNKNEIPIHSDDHLNERYYGILQGKNKNEVRKEFGEEQVFFWRRSWTTRPPKGENLKDVYKRVIPYFKSKILPHLRANQNVLIVAHGNSLRALVKFIDSITDEDIPYLEIDLAKPIIYEYKNNMLVKKSCEHVINKPKKKKIKLASNTIK